MFYELKDLHLDQSLKKTFFPARNFYPFLYSFEIKKGLNLEHFSKTILQMAILGEKQKNFFFSKLHQNCKHTIRLDFWSKNLLGYKLRFFFSKSPLFCFIFSIFFFLKVLFPFCCNFLNRDFFKQNLKRYAWFQRHIFLSIIVIFW